MSFGISEVAQQIDMHARSLRRLRVSLTEMYRSISVQEMQGLNETAERIAINHSFSKSDLRSLMGVSGITLSKKLEQAQADGVIGQHFEFGGAHRYFHEDVLRFLDWCDYPSYQKECHPICLAVTNHKGGVSKTTSCVTLAFGLALDVQRRPRVIVVDLDPQGTATQAVADPTKIDPDRLQVTALDIVLSKMEREKQLNEDGAFHEIMEYLEGEGMDWDAAFDEILLNAPLPSHLSNLSVLAAFTSDERFSDIYGSLTPEQSREIILTFSQKMIPKLKEHYDIIIVDSPPQDTAYTWMAIDAADGLLVPTGPSTFDVSSTTNYLTSLAQRLEHFPSGSDHLKFYRMMITNFNKNNRVHEEARRRLIQASKGLLLSKHLVHSPLFSLAAEANVSVFDYIQKEVLDLRIMSAPAFNETKTNLQDWLKEIMDLIETFSGRQDVL